MTKEASDSMYRYILHASVPRNHVMQDIPLGEYEFAVPLVDRQRVAVLVSLKEDKKVLEGVVSSITQYGRETLGDHALAPYAVAAIRVATRTRGQKILEQLLGERRGKTNHTKL